MACDNYPQRIMVLYIRCQINAIERSLSNIILIISCASDTDFPIKTDNIYTQLIDQFTLSNLGKWDW